MFLPPPAMQVHDLYTERRVRNLEQALDLSLTAIQLLVNRLEAKFGPDFLGDDLQPFKSSATSAEMQAEAAQISRWIAEGNEPQAVRHLRDVCSITWDETRSAIQSWKRSSPADRVRSLKLARYIKSITAAQSQ